MQKLSKQIGTEFLWLAFTLSLATALAMLLFGQTVLTRTVDIHLHDTYFVVAPLQILTPLFFLVTFIVYYIKELRRSFQRTLSNWILLLSGLALIVALTLAIKVFSAVFTGGLTAYPPLSALTPDTIPAPTQDPAIDGITNFFIGLQLLILGLLLHAAYRWGGKKRKGPNTP